MNKKILGLASILAAILPAYAQVVNVPGDSGSVRCISAMRPPGKRAILVFNNYTAAKPANLTFGRPFSQVANVVYVSSGLSIQLGDVGLTGCTIPACSGQSGRIIIGGL